MEVRSFALTRWSAAALLASIGAVLMLALPSGAYAGTFAPVADAYVDSASPGTNYGRSVSLKTDASPILDAYMRFNVSGVGPTTTAKLRVHAETGSSTGFQVRSVTGTGANTWGETSINFNSAPALGPVIGSVTGVQAGNWYTIDVSSAVAGDGLVTLALTSTSTTGVRYSSREGATPPELITPAPPPPLGSYLVSESGGTYQALSQTGGASFSGTLKSVLQSAAVELQHGGGGMVTFTAGIFDFGSERFEGLKGLTGITFQGQGIDTTVLQNNSSLATDTEPFDMSISFGIVIRDMTISAGGPFRSTSDAIDFDGGNEVVVERVKVTGSRGRGIVFDGKDMNGTVPRTADHNVIRDCVIDGVPSDGIELLAAQHNRIEGCVITNAGGHGIQLSKASASAGQPHKKPSDNVVTGNSVTNAGQDGINVTSGDLNQILGNTVLNSSNLTSGKDGIRILSADSIACDDNVVQSNRSGDDQTPKTQRYGLQIASALCHRTVVSGNDFTGNLSGAIRDLGTGTLYP